MNPNAPNQKPTYPLDLQLMLFSETSNPKSYRISLRTIHRLGFFLGSLVLVSLILMASTIRNLVRPTPASDTAAAPLALTREIEGLQKKIAQLESERQTTLPAATSTSTPAPTAISGQISSQPSQPPTGTALPAQTNSQQGDGSVVSQDLASLFQPSVRFTKPASEALPIKIDGFKISARGSNVRIRFALQYVRQDKGNLEGRILILAKGPGLLLTYPVEALHFGPTQGLLIPQSGEFFSVSRYREVKAEFGPTPKDSPIQSLAVFLFSSDDQLLFHEVHKIKREVKSEPKPTEPAEAEPASEPKEGQNP